MIGQTLLTPMLRFGLVLVFLVTGLAPPAGALKEVVWKIERRGGSLESFASGWWIIHDVAPALCFRLMVVTGSGPPTAMTRQVAAPHPGQPAQPPGQAEVSRTPHK